MKGTTHDKVDSERGTLAVVNLTQTKVNDRVVVVRLVSDPPAQVHHLGNQPGRGGARGGKRGNAPLSRKFAPPKKLESAMFSH